jgi:hypothetical protein
VAHAVEVAGVEQRDAGLERGMDGGDALVAVGGAVEVGHAHGAKADGGDGGAGGTEFAFFHDNSPRDGGVTPRMTRRICAFSIAAISWTIRNRLFII